MLAPSDEADISVAYQGGFRVTSEDDGFEAAKAAFEIHFDENTPTVLSAPIDVVVGTLDEPNKPGKIVLRFTVEPPSLAF